METIRPCPFCGSKQVGFCFNDGNTSMWVECDDCGAEGSGATIQADAVESWNRVSDAAANARELESLVDLLRSRLESLGSQHA